MKSKINIKLLLFILSLLFFILTIFLIRSTYARYITSLTARSSVEMGSWFITVNDQNIVENSDISNIVTPIFNEDSEYIAENKIAPTSTGYVLIEVDYSKVTVPFNYTISFSSAGTTSLEDFNLVSYTVNGGSIVEVGNSSTTITDTVSPTDAVKIKNYKLNLQWFDGTGEHLSDIQDTAFSRNNSNIGLRLNMTFNQLAE